MKCTLQPSQQETTMQATVEEQAWHFSWNTQQDAKGIVLCDQIWFADSAHTEMQLI